MANSTPFAEILARLGATGSTLTGGSSSEAFNIPLLNSSGLLDPSFFTGEVLTSVGFSTNATFFTVSNSPLTSNGTITMNLTTGLSQNMVVATPASGTGTLGVRSLVINDIPSLSSIYLPLAGGTMTGDLTLFGNPVNPFDAATKSYVDQYIQGISWKNPVAAASPSNITISSPGTTFDGYVATSGDRIGLISQSTSSQNGIYIFNGSSSAMTRSTDMNTSAEVQNAAFFVEQGSTYANALIVCNTPPPITLGVTPLSFIKFSSGVGTVTSVGLSTTASWLTVASSPITTSGTITLNPTTGLTANQFVATPNGSTGAVSLRAIVSADIPTLNQNTTGSAASFTGSLSGDVTGTQGATVVGRINGTSLAGLSSGVLYNTTSTGIPSIATANQLAAGITGTTGTLNFSSATVTIPTLPVNQGGTGLTTTSQNFVFAGPTSGAGAPTWRLLVSGDIPSLASIYLPLSGGTLTGNLAMGSNNITGTGTHFATTFTGLVSTGTAGSLTMSGGSGSGGNAGSITTSGGSTGAGGSINTSASTTFAGGSIVLNSNGSNAAGSINTQAGGGITTGAGTLTGPATTGYILASVTSVTTVTGTPSSTTFLRGDGTWSVPSGGGSVTSVGLSTTASWFTVGSSPITGSGVITLNPTTGLTANQFVATPNGTTGTVSLRSIVAADIPTLNQNTTGSAGSFTGSLAGDVTGPQGTTVVGKINGTSLAGLASGVLYNTTTTGVPSIATANQIAAGLTGTTGTLNFSSATLTIPTLPIGQGGTGLTTTSQSFVFIGPASGSGAPTWRVLASGDIPSLASIYLPLAGGTMAGNIAMGANNITGTGTVNATTFSGLVGTAAAGTLTMSGGSSAGGIAGTIITSGGSTGAGGLINTSGNSTFSGGAITTKASSTVGGGAINTGGGSGTGTSGAINTVGGTSSGNGGAITTSGGSTGSGGAVNTSASTTFSGGAITTNASTTANGGSINTVGGTSTGAGGSINTSGGSTGAGGSINTSGTTTTSGGSINTTAGGGLTTGAGLLTGPATSGFVLASVTSVTTATGTPSSSNFLRGDGTWSVPSGSSTYTVTSYTTSQSVAATNLSLYIFNGTSLTCTLPTATSAAGFAITIKNLNSTSLEVTPNGSDTIDLINTSIFLAYGDSITIIGSTGAWTKI